MGEQRGDRERDERNDGRLLEEQQAAEVHQQRPSTAYRWLPVRTSSTASPHTHAIAASIGSEFSAAAHHANAGTPSGVNNANVNGSSSTGRQPRMTCSARNSASEANSCSTTRLIAGPTQFNGASRVMPPATRKPQA